MIGKTSFCYEFQSAALVKVKERYKSLHVKYVKNIGTHKILSRYYIKQITAFYKYKNE